MQGQGNAVQKEEAAPAGCGRTISTLAAVAASAAARFPFRKPRAS